MGKTPKPDEPKMGPPAYMVSFADMMTLILTFFILLVSMSKERNLGLLAKGLGSFIVALESHGMDGIMSGAEKKRVFEHMRRRFNLPPEPDEERREDHIHASQLELLRADALESLEPHGIIPHPRIAEFPVGKSTLDDAGRAYLDRIADTLRPAYGQVLILEGHFEFSRESGAQEHYVAYLRAEAVREYLLEEHGFAPKRVESRAWLNELDDESLGLRTVDARLITPSQPKDE